MLMLTVDEHCGTISDCTALRLTLAVSSRNMTSVVLGTPGQVMRVFTHRRHDGKVWSHWVALYWTSETFCSFLTESLPKGQRLEVDIP